MKIIFVPVLLIFLQVYLFVDYSNVISLYIVSALSIVLSMLWVSIFCALFCIVYRTLNTKCRRFCFVCIVLSCVQINKLMKDVNKLKRENIKLNLLSNKENQLLKQQVTALRHELANTVKKFSTLRIQLDAEVRK